MNEVTEVANYYYPGAYAKEVCMSICKNTHTFLNTRVAFVHVINRKYSRLALVWIPDFPNPIAFRLVIW